MSTIVVVEDLRDLRELVERVLKAQGHTVLALGHSEDALQIAKDPKLVVDVLITDWNLPGVSGQALALALRQQYPQLRVLLMTGERLEDLKSLDWMAGWGEYLAKPFDFDAMLSALKRLQALP